MASDTAQKNEFVEGFSLVGSWFLLSVRDLTKDLKVRPTKAGNSLKDLEMLRQDKWGSTDILTILLKQQESHDIRWYNQKTVAWTLEFNQGKWELKNPKWEDNQVWQQQQQQQQQQHGTKNQRTGEPHKTTSSNNQNTKLQRDGEGRIDKGGGGWSMSEKVVCEEVVCERWCVTMLRVEKLRVCVCVCGRGCVAKRVCNQVVYERWCVTKMCVWKMVCNQDVCVCVKDDVWQSCVWKMVCDKVVCVWQSCVCVTKLCVCVTKLCVCVTKMCVKDGVWLSCVWQRWWVTKMCVKDGVWQRCVWKMVCVTKLCVTMLRVWQSCVWKIVCDKVVCERWCVCDKVVCACANKCKACHAKRRWMSPRAMLAMQDEGRCHQVPRLPRKTNVDVTTCHACHVKRRRMSPTATPATQSGAASGGPSAPPEPAQSHKWHACHAERR